MLFNDFFKHNKSSVNACSILRNSSQLPRSSSPCLCTIKLLMLTLRSRSGIAPWIALNRSVLWRCSKSLSKRFKNVKSSPTSLATRSLRLLKVVTCLVLSFLLRAAAGRNACRLLRSRTNRFSTSSLPNLLGSISARVSSKRPPAFFLVITPLLSMACSPLIRLLLRMFCPQTMKSSFRSFVKCYKSWLRTLK